MQPKECVVSPELPKKRRFWTNLIVLLAAIVILTSISSYVVAALGQLRSFWGNRVFLHLPLGSGPLRSFLEYGLSLVFSFLISWVLLIIVGRLRQRRLRQRAHARAELARTHRPVFVPHTVGRYDFGWITREQETTLASDDGSTLRLYSVFLPSYPGMVTGKIEFATRDAILRINNDVEDVAKFFARAGFVAIEWDVTDADGKRVDVQLGHLALPPRLLHRLRLGLFGRQQRCP